MAATAGFNTALKVGGTSTAFTGEATTNTTGDSYQITNTAKRVLDPTVAITVYDGVTPVVPTVIDWLFGVVTLPAPPVGAVTIDGSYIPLLTVAQGQAATTDTSVDALDASVFGSRDRVFVAGLRTLTIELETLDTLDTDLDSSGDTWTWNAKASGVAILVQVDWAGDGANLSRCWSLISGTSVGSVVDDLVNGKISIQSAPVRAADGSLVTFSTGT